MTIAVLIREVSYWIAESSSSGLGQFVKEGNDC